MKKAITISDPTLRDGNHAAKHQINLEQIAAYTKMADEVGIDIVEVGHGCGLGGSSLQFGRSLHSDQEILRCARNQLKHSKLGIHIIPGIGRKSDVDIAITEGVDVFRVGSHCTEADTTRNLIEYINKKDKVVFGVLMMSHMADESLLLKEAAKMVSYGAHGIILMDSAGALTPIDVKNRVSTLMQLSVAIGFHAHNNLGLSVANSVAAVESGATIVDGTARGYGAGAGNTPIELLAVVLDKLNYKINVDCNKILDAADYTEKHLIDKTPSNTTSTIASGLNGVFSGFAKHVEKAANDNGLDTKIIYRELGKRKVVAGQEDVIMDVVQSLLNERSVN
jgi:4-hydroxy 2-oxovalerate aldolase